MTELEFHEMASIFPLMSEGELAGLAEDIRRNGLKEAIWLYEGKILDGRNRYRACKMAEVEPQTRVYTGDAAVDFVVSLNLRRRHLSQSQKAAVALEVLPWFERQARKRQAHGATTWGKSLVEKIPQATLGKARDQAAAAVGLNPRYVSDCKRIQRKAPELYEQIKSGEKTIRQARLELRKAEHAQRFQEAVSNPEPS